MSVLGRRDDRLEPFTAASRRALLDAYAAAVARLSDAGDAYDEAPDTEREALGAEMDRWVATVSALREEYRARVPVLPLSRCPFTGVLVRHSIDPFGIDGLWWDYEGPARPDEDLPPTYFALAGALRFGGAVEHTDFLVRPGPEAPYVVPRLLEHPGIKAVVTSIRVGTHEAYPIFYFADPVPRDIDRLNTWGTAQYWAIGARGEPGWDDVYEDVGDYDFDLRPWIHTGKLSWVRSGDAQVALRRGVADCPYLDLPGRRELMHIKYGRVWTLADGAAFQAGEGA